MTQSTATPPARPAPEGEAAGMFGPGQQEQLEQFLAREEQTGATEALAGQPPEQQQEQQEKSELLLGKFKSADELAKAYQELERKLGERPQGEEQKAEKSPDPSTYTREQGNEFYGEELAGLLEQAEINPLELQKGIESGELTLEAAIDQLDEALPFGRGLIEAYVNGLYGQPQGGEQPQPVVTAEDEARIRQSVGGDDAFQQLSRWAVDNLGQEELGAYSEAVNLGHPLVSQMAVQWLAARQQLAQATGRKEPELLGGGTAPATQQFQTEAEALEAMNKRNSRGQRLYDVDEAYRARIAQALAGTNLFS